MESRTQARRARRAKARRMLAIAVAGAVTAVLSLGYIVADIADVVPGPLTLKPVQYRSVPSAMSSVPSSTLVGKADSARAVDAAAAKRLIDDFAATDGVGDDVSVAISGADGRPVAQLNADTVREPASTLKTATMLAASETLDMGDTLATSAYLDRSEATSDDTATDDDAAADGTDSAGVPTLTLTGEGDMLLGEGASDPNHVNGRAGLDTLAERTAKALAQRSITSVRLVYDDSLFGDERYPANIDENNGDYLYYTGVSSMAIDGGRQWADDKPADPDVFSAYPPLSQHTAQDVASVFAQRLVAHGITVDGEVTAGKTPSGISPLASVESATLGEIMAFTLRHSDNTLAEEFGRLTAIAQGADNSPEGAVKAVKAELERLGVDTTGLTMADCSGLSPGSRVSVLTLLDVQAHNLTASGGAAAAEGLSIPGLVGTAANRAVSADTAGQIRVKTGSLGTVTSMVGNVSRTDGGVLAFAVIVNNPKDMAAARSAIDSFVDALARL